MELDRFSIIAIICLGGGIGLLCILCCLYNLSMGNDALEGFCRPRHRRRSVSTVSGGGGDYGDNVWKEQLSDDDRHKKELTVWVKVMICSKTMEKIYSSIWSHVDWLTKENHR